MHSEWLKLRETKRKQQRAHKEQPGRHQQEPSDHERLCAQFAANARKVVFQGNTQDVASITCTTRAQTQLLLEAATGKELAANKMRQVPAMIAEVRDMVARALQSVRQLAERGPA